LPTQWLWRAILPIALLVILLGFAVVDHGVLSLANLLNIAQQTSYLALFAMAQTVVILTRGFDLALGPTVSMVSVGTALAMAGATASGHDTTAVLLAGLGAGFGLGIGCGLFNGVVIAILGVSPFVATLGSYNIAIGVATTLSAGRPVQGVPKLFSQIFYGGTVFGVPAAIAITVVVGVVLQLMLARTVFGRSIYIIGTNPRAAAVAGMPVKSILVATYVLCSVLAALGAIGIAVSIFLTGVEAFLIHAYCTWCLVQAIAGAVVGGTSLAGGRGGVGTAVLGALFVTILSNGMNLTRIDGYVQMVVLGAIIITGVLLDRLRLERR